MRMILTSPNTLLKTFENINKIEFEVFHLPDPSKRDQVKINQMQPEHSHHAQTYFPGLNQSQMIANFG
jgi:hypothetical protein